MTNNLSLSVSKVFKCDAKTLFNAIGEGALIKHTGSIPEKTHIDFKVGGKYSAAWDSCEDTHGEFLEISPYSKIVFTWNKTPKNEAAFNSTVTLLLSENLGATTLYLKHEGLPGEKEYGSHSDGWQHTLKGMYGELQKYFAKLEGNTTGLDINFDIGETINAPIEQVFEYVKNDSHLQKYFKVKMSDAFCEDKTIEWDFEDCPNFKLHTHQVIQNELIKFKWDDTHVVFCFSAPNKNTTTVKIHTTGFKHTQDGLKSAFSECNGWTEFLTALKKYAENKK